MAAVGGALSPKEPLMARILAIPPHPDDEVLGCGGSIAAHIAAGSDVTIAHLTSGERGTTASATASGRNREREAVTAATVLGVPDRAVRFLRIPDGGINPFD